MLKCGLLIFFGSILFLLSSLHWWASCIWFSSSSLCSHGKHPKVFAYTSICTSVVSPLSKQSIVIRSPNYKILVFKAYEMLVMCGYGGLPGSGNYLACDFVIAMHVVGEICVQKCLVSSVWFWRSVWSLRFCQTLNTVMFLLRVQMFEYTELYSCNNSGVFLVLLFHIF